MSPESLPPARPPLGRPRSSTTVARLPSSSTRGSSPDVSPRPEQDRFSSSTADRPSSGASCRLTSLVCCCRPLLTLQPSSYPSSSSEAQQVPVLSHGRFPPARSPATLAHPSFTPKLALPPVRILPVLSEGASRSSVDIVRRAHAQVAFAQWPSFVRLLSNSTCVRGESSSRKTAQAGAQLSILQRLHNLPLVRLRSHPHPPSSNPTPSVALARRLSDDDLLVRPSSSGETNGGCFEGQLGGLRDGENRPPGGAGLSG